MIEEERARPITISEVKNVLKKVEKDRKEMLYEQKIALEHAQKFARLSVKKAEELVKELLKLEFLQDIHAYKITDILPTTDDDVKTIFAKERITLSENDIKKILELVKKYLSE